MHPILFEIGRFPLHTYGVLIALGFLSGTFYMRYEAKRLGWDPEKVVDFCFMALFLGFVGCRLFFVLTQLPYFLDHPAEILAVWEGGMVFYGGPLVVAPWALWWMRKNKLPMGTMSDLAVQTLTLGHAIGRWACLAAGCCYGKECGYPWAIRLHSELVDVHLRGAPLHPVQIYESLALFTLFFFLRWLWKHRRFDGQTTLVYFMAYAVIRSIMETFRGDVVRGFVVQDLISTSQFISILVFTITAALYWRLSRKAPKRRP
jgi:phosphatidylglycerol:prolipoprotein diacylglycerol transferase